MYLGFSTPKLILIPVDDLGWLVKTNIGIWAAGFNSLTLSLAGIGRWVGGNNIKY